MALTALARHKFMDLNESATYRECEQYVVAGQAANSAWPVLFPCCVVARERRMHVGRHMHAGRARAHEPALPPAAWRSSFGWQHSLTGATSLSSLSSASARRPCQAAMRSGRRSRPPRLFRRLNSPAHAIGRVGGWRLLQNDIHASALAVVLALARNPTHHDYEPTIPTGPIEPVTDDGVVAQVVPELVRRALSRPVRPPPPAAPCAPRELDATLPFCACAEPPMVRWPCGRRTRRPAETSTTPMPG